MEERKENRNRRFPHQSNGHADIQGGLWLIGIAIIVWQEWYWPGLLILAGLSAMLEGVLRTFASKKMQ